MRKNLKSTYMVLVNKLGDILVTVQRTLFFVSSFVEEQLQGASKSESGWICIMFGPGPARPGPSQFLIRIQILDPTYFL